jgi:hypothetical protein
MAKWSSDQWLAWIIPVCLDIFLYLEDNYTWSENEDSVDMVQQTG